MIDEIKSKMGSTIPDCIIASVGGGGLMCGIIEGLIRNQWINEDIKIVAVETEGADCFNQSVKQNKLVTLNAITRYSIDINHLYWLNINCIFLFVLPSVAKSLGAKTCSKKLFDYYKQYKDKIESIVLSDEESLKGSLRFLGRK